MDFFVNQYLLGKNSSVEHAELKRLQLFKDHQTPAQLVTRDFDPVLHRTMQRFGVTNDQLTNLYDFFAQTTDYQGQPLHTEDLKLAVDYQISTGNNFREVRDGGRLAATIYFAGGTIGQIHHIDWYDQTGSLTLRNTYDIRGFKAVDEFFGQDGHEFNARYYRPDGQLYLERYFVKSVQNTPINSLNILKNWHGQDHWFASENEMFAFFLDELNRAHGENNVFIADRPAVAIDPILHMHSKVHRYLWLPMSHVNDGQDPLKAPLNSLLQNALTENLHRWDGIIVMTQAQARVLRQRLGKSARVLTINGTPVKKAAKRVKMAARTPNQLISVGRLGYDKQTDQLLQVFAKIKAAVPDAKLTLYGYGMPNDTANFKQLAKDLQIDDAVEFADYQYPLDAAFDQAQLLLNTSRIDAQPLAMGEALGHGVPVVSYDFSYGPDEMIVNYENGRLIALNHSASMAKAVVELLSSPAKLQQLSDHAYDDLDNISAAATWKQWQAVK